MLFLFTQTSIFGVLLVRRLSQWKTQRHSFERRIRVSNINGLDEISTAESNIILQNFWGENGLLTESLASFLIILIVSSLIYLCSRLLTQKSPTSKEKTSMYACGEKVFSKRLLVNVTLYKYLIFFVIIDSPALILAFAALALEMISPFILLIYLGIILAADLLLLGGY